MGKSIFLENNLRLQSDLKSDRQGGRPGLVVMGDDSCLKGRGFESRRRIPDGHLKNQMRQIHVF